jgi:hypothetical protein
MSVAHTVDQDQLVADGFVSKDERQISEDYTADMGEAF